MMDDAVVACKYAPNAVAVSWGSYTSCGPLDEQDITGTDPSGMLIRERAMRLRVPTTHLEDIARGDTVVATRRGVRTSYRVREVELEDDGEVKALVLARIA
jgi:hypothetical protein